MKWFGRIFCLAALGLIASTTDWRQFLRVLQRVDSVLIITAFAYMLGIDLLRAWKMAIMVAEGEHAKKYLIPFYRYNIASSFYSLILPGDVFGSGVRWHYYRKTVGGYDAVLMVIIDNYTQFFAVFLLFIPAVIFITHTIVPGLVVAAIMAMMISSPFLLRKTSLLTRITPKKPQFIRTTLHYMNEKMKTIRVLDTRMRYLFLISIAYQCLISFYIWLLTTAAAIPVDWYIIIFAITGLMIIQFIPGLLGGIGIREASLAGMLFPFGVSTEEAVLLGLLISLLSIARGLVGGLVVLTMKAGK